MGRGGVGAGRLLQRDAAGVGGLGGVAGVWVRWTWSMPWRFFLRDEGVTRTRTVGRERVWPFSLPASKYSMSRLVWLGYFLCSEGLVVLMVTGVPSSGML